MSQTKKHPRLRKDGQPSQSGAHFKDPAFQRRMRARVSSASCAANGRKGYQATRNKYGPAFTSRVLAEYRRTFPSQLVRKVCTWLDEFQVDFALEVEISHYFADIVVTYINLVIEVDGAIWHTQHALHGEDRVARDAKKDRLFMRHGYAVLHLSEADIKNGSAKDKLDRALHQCLLGR